jgi:hypothetical protein
LDHCAWAAVFLLAADPNPCPRWGYVSLHVGSAAAAPVLFNLLNTGTGLLFAFIKLILRFAYYVFRKVNRKRKPLNA